MDVAVYARLSRADLDAAADATTATQRQIADCKARAEREGWNVVGVYEDPDSSASNLRKKRPDFERMLADLGNGVRVDAVLTYKLDRLLRHPKESERLLDLADSRQIGIVSLNDPGLDLATPTGRAMFRMTVVWAKLETETMSLRIRRKFRDEAKEGKPHMGGSRPFGVRKDNGTLVIVPEEAALIREAAELVLAGASLHSICIDWRKRGITSTRGKPFMGTTLRQVLVAPRLVGDRLHRGAVAGTGKMPVILDRETFDQLQVVLNTRTSNYAYHGRVRTHIYTGLMVCGRCNTKMMGDPYFGVPRYRCKPLVGCGRVSVNGKFAEPLVTEALMQRLDSPEFREALATRAKRPDPTDVLVRLRADEAALAEAANDYYVNRTLPKTEYFAVRDVLEERVAATRMRLSESATTNGLARAAAIVDPRAEWDRQSLQWRNEFARQFISRIIIKPSRIRSRFEPERVDIEWRDTA